MDLQLNQREKEGIRILDLRGRLKTGASAITSRSAIIELAETRVVNIILNLAEISKIDADGLASLEFCNTRIRMSGGALKLLNLNRDRFSLSLLTKLDTVFDVFTDEQDAIDSFFPDRAARHFDILEWVRGQEKRAEHDPPH